MVGGGGDESNGIGDGKGDERGGEIDDKNHGRAIRGAVEGHRLQK